MSGVEAVVEFLKESKTSYKVFDKLLAFYDFKYEVMHKQYFREVCDEIYKFFRDHLSVDNIKITKYDIEHSVEKILYLKGNDFNENRDNNILNFDFSKSYALNGRIFFQIDSKEKFQEIEADKNFLNYILFELKGILSNYLAIEKLKESSYIDDLTNIPNRRFLIAHLNSTIPIAKKENIKIAFLKIEVDRLKAVTEEFNYEITNSIIKLLANSLKKYVHDTDLLTKFEGDSFMIAMQDFKDIAEISSLAQKCIDDFASKSVIINHKTNQKLQKTICIGVSVYPDDGTQLEDIFRNSDIALDEAKNRGRGSFEFYKDEQNSALDLF